MPEINKKPSQETVSDYKEFFKVTGTDETEILTQIRVQAQEGITFSSRVREELQADFILFKDQKNAEDLVGDTTLFNVHTALMARSVQDKPVALFKSEDVSVFEAVTNLNSAYKEDFEEGDYDVVNYYKDWFKYLFGVGIVARNGWDGSRKATKFQWVDPRIWVPDPNGDYVTGNYSYCGFEKLLNKEAVETSGWMNLDSLAVISYAQYSADLLKKRDQALDKLVNPGTNKTYNPWYDLYYHYFAVDCADGQQRKAMAIMGNNKTLLLKLKLLPAVSKDEENDPQLIPFPFDFDYWKPEPNNPYGDRPANKCRDVQKQKAILANLRLKKSKAELYPMYFYNKRYVQNKADLSFGFNKFIAVDTGAEGNVSLDAIVRPFKPDSQALNSLTIDNSLDQQLNRSLSVGDITMGSTPDQRETATTNTLVQSNTDLNLSLNSKVSTWFHRSMLRNWLRWYLENFEDGDRKLVQVNTWIGEIPVSLKKKDFLVGLRVKIQITTKSQIKQERAEQNAGMTEMMTFLQAADLKPIEKKMILRDLAELKGYPPEKILTRLWPDPQESLAKTENDLLLRGFSVDINPDDDHYTHLVMHNAAGDSLDAELHRRAHMEAYVRSGQNAVTWTENQGMQNALVAQNASQMAAKNANALAPQAGQITA